MNVGTPGDSFEDYINTLTFADYHQADNDATFVELCNVTGAGLMMWASLVSSDPNGNAVMRFTIDGGTALTMTIGDTNGAMSLSTGMIPFSTSFKLEMRLGGAGAGVFSCMIGTE